MELDFRSLWDQALPYHQFVQEAGANHELWEGMYRIARVPDWALAATRATATKHRLLVIAEDWCGDGTSTIPYLAKLADSSPNVEVRVLRRDEHPVVMDHYLTGTARSIPIVIVLDGDFREQGHWGPRPAALEEWAREARKTKDKAALFPLIRRWYARDKGESTLREVLQIVEQRLPALASVDS
jgi:thioredoxin family protein